MKSFLRVQCMSNALVERGCGHIRTSVRVKLLRALLTAWACPSGSVTYQLPR